MWESVYTERWKLERHPGDEGRVYERAEEWAGKMAQQFRVHPASPEGRSSVDAPTLGGSQLPAYKFNPSGAEVHFWFPQAPASMCTYQQHPHTYTYKSFE